MEERKPSQMWIQIVGHKEDLPYWRFPVPLTEIVGIEIALYDHYIGEPIEKKILAVAMIDNSLKVMLAQDLCLEDEAKNRP